MEVRRTDLIGLATSWSAPPDKTLRSQWTSEAFYRLQLFQNMAVSPGFQFTVHPSNTLETDVLGVMSVLRIRLAF
jgi:porin